MADLKIKIKVNDEGDNLTKLSNAINGLYPTWQTDNPDMEIEDFVEKLIMEEYLIKLINNYECNVIHTASMTSVSALTALSVDHDDS